MLSVVFIWEMNFDSELVFLNGEKETKTDIAQITDKMLQATKNTSFCIIIINHLG